MKKEITYLGSFDIGYNSDDNYTFFDFMNEYDIDEICEMFFQMGKEKMERPVRATGWRYGEFTDYGRSNNYRDNKLEKGISLMEVYVNGELKDKASTASALWFEDSGKERIEVTGWWTPDVWGTDGEPLMLLAKHK
jgi:hypothetical protein